MKIKSVTLRIDEDELLDRDQIKRDMEGLTRYLKDIPALSGFEIAGDKVTVVNHFTAKRGPRLITVEFEKET